MEHGKHHSKTLRYTQWILKYCNTPNTFCIVRIWNSSHSKAKYMMCILITYILHWSHKIWLIIRERQKAELKQIRKNDCQPYSVESTSISIFVFYLFSFVMMLTTCMIEASIPMNQVALVAVSERLTDVQKYSQLWRLYNTLEIF